MSNSEMTCVNGADALLRVAPLFDGWEETMVWTALEGKIGRVWVSPPHGCPPAAALCHTKDLVFLSGAGDGEEASRLLHGLKQELSGQFSIITPQNKSWHSGIETAFPQMIKSLRYAIKKEGDVFDRAKLAQLSVKLPPNTELRFIDGPLYDLAKSQKWSSDFCFGTKEDFLAHGIGVLALENGEPVGGASSFIYYSKGIEVQVETRKDKRRQGIAAAACARLILACLEKGLYPSWDAANLESVALAEKLGYHLKGPYVVWITKEE